MTEKEKRKKRQNTFAPELPRDGYGTTEWRNGGTSSKNAKPRITKKTITNKYQHNNNIYININTPQHFHHQHNTTQYLP